MTSPLRLHADHTALLVIDIQERLFAAMPDGSRQDTAANAVRLVRGCDVLGIPVLVTEQYPQGLGPTVPALRAALDDLKRPAHVIEKRAFSICDVPACAQLLDPEGPRGTLVVAGLEAHICVYQTVRDLVAHGHQVHVASDATNSRNPSNHRIAEGLWTRAGAVVSSTEAILFDLVGCGEGESFKAISRLVR